MPDKEKTASEQETPVEEKKDVVAPDESQTQQEDQDQAIDYENIDVDNLTREEIDNVDLNKVADGDLIEDPEAVIEKKPDEKVDTDDKGKETPESEEEENDDKVDWKKRFTDTQSSFTQSQQKLKKTEATNKDLSNKLKDIEFGEFEELSKDEALELREDDPDAYISYREQEFKYKHRQQEKESSAQQEVHNFQIGNILKFADGIGISGDEALTEFFKSDKFKTIDQFVTKSFKPNEKGLYTPEQMKQAHDMLFVDDIVKSKMEQATQKTREDTLANIEKAQGGGSLLDKIAKTSETERKPASSLTVDDIDTMTEAQTDQYLKDLKNMET